MSLYRSSIKMLSDLISPKALERMLADAARERHTSLSELDLPTLQGILKQDVYRRLQLNVPAALAKRRVQSVLDALEEEARSGPSEESSHTTQLITLDQLARQYALYFDWPETQRLRSVLAVARQQDNEGGNGGGGAQAGAAALVREANELLEALERRLSEALVTQGQDLSELKAGLLRVSGVGGPKVRRLEAMIKQIQEAQEARTVLPAEVERALALNLTLRKLVESSVMQNLRPPPTALEGGGEASDAAASDAAGQAEAALSFDTLALPEEAQERVRTLDREHEARQLAELGREHAVLLRQDARLEQHLHALRGRSEAGEVLGEASVQALREDLQRATHLLWEGQHRQLEALEDRLVLLEARPDAPQGTAQARQSLLVMQGTLRAGVLEQSELLQLGDTVQTLEQGGAASLLLDLQRETYELERSAREVPGAHADLLPLLAEARARLSSGQVVNLDALWQLLERRMGEAAQQREGMDARADRIMQDYDQYRSLAGETIQKLGRLADVLRAQRRLGTLSSDARERYLQTLDSAEGLRDEAAAEFRAAREVTSAFGADALSNLLGVFETGDSGGSGGSALGGALGGFSGPGSPAAGTPSTSGAPLLFAPPSASVPAVQVPAPLPSAPLPTAPLRAWVVRQGQVTEGELSPAGPWATPQDCEADVLRVAWLLEEAAELGPLRLTLQLPGQVWLAQPQAAGALLVVCGPDLGSAEQLARQWSDSAGSASAGGQGP